MSPIRPLTLPQWDIWRERYRKDTGAKGVKQEVGKKQEMEEKQKGRLSVEGKGRVQA
jgi:hypothetical protein